MSHQELFGDDSSDDDDIDNQQTRTTTMKPDPPADKQESQSPPTRKTIASDSDSDDDDEEMKDADDEEEDDDAVVPDNNNNNNKNAKNQADDNKRTTSSTSNDKKNQADKDKEEQDPFAEASSSSDSDIVAKKRSPPKTNQPSLDDSDDDDEDDPPARRGVPHDHSDDDQLQDSDDDDEPEFDDAGAVIGTARDNERGFTRKASKAPTSTLDRIREREQEERRLEEAASSPQPKHKKPHGPKLDPRTLVVPHVSRPHDQVSLHVTKLPNVIGIQPEAFDPTTYSAAVEEQEYSGHVHDMIRWRYQVDATTGDKLRDPETHQLLRESNARLVEWDDGSFTLHVGKEALEVDAVDSSTKDTGFAGLNGYVYMSQRASYRMMQQGDEEETPTSTVLECMGPVASRMTARPSSLRSEAHKSLTVAVRQKTIKKARIAEFVTQLDPEKEKEARIRAKADFEKSEARKRKAAGYDGDRFGGYARPRARPGMNRRYLEQDEGDFDTINLRGLKKKTLHPDDEDMDDYGSDDYGDDDEDDDDDDEDGTFNRKRRPTKKLANKNRLDSDSDEEEETFGGGGAKDSEDDDDDDDDEVVAPVKSTKKRAHQAVVDDDDSD